MTSETLKNPNVPTLLNPIGIDAAIQAIQIDLSSLSWLEKSFGRAWTMPRQVLDQKTVEPMVYQGSAEYYPVLPNDALKSYSFFRVSGGRTSEQYAANLNYGGSYMFRDPVDLIVWCDLQKIDPTKNYIFKEELIQSVMVRLNRNASVEVVRVWDDKAEEIFRGYTLKEQHRDLLMYPFTAFRIEMVLRYQFACVTPWILEEGVWNDAGEWKDEEVWKDSV